MSEDPQISYAMRRITDFEKNQRRLKRLVPIEGYHVCTITVEGQRHCGEGESQATALRRAADHWERWVGKERS